MCVLCARMCLASVLFCSRSDRSRCNQWRCVRIATANYQINEEIRDKEVRVIGADGAQLGIMSSAAALEIAEGKDLDLVKIAPGSNPPVCKIMDYGKYRFEQAKREKEARKNQHVIEVKEIRMSPGIGENDWEMRESVCSQLGYFGVEFDAEHNANLPRPLTATEISKPTSKVKVFMIPTNEELVIASDTERIVKAL